MTIAFSMTVCADSPRVAPSARPRTTISDCRGERDCQGPARLGGPSFGKRTDHRKGHPWDFRRFMRTKHQESRQLLSVSSSGLHVLYVALPAFRNKGSVHFSVECRPDVFQSRTKLGRAAAPSCPNPGRCWPKLGRHWSKLVVFWPTLANFARKGRILVDVDHVWP